MKMKKILKKFNSKLLKSVNLDSFSKDLDFIGINYSVISKEGDYIIQNSTMVTDITKGKNKAEEIDPCSWADCVKVMESGEKKIIEETFEDKTYLSIKKPIFDEENCLGVAVLSVDITDQKQAEISKRKFIDSIHHDIKTPFFGLHMLSGGMAKHETDPEKKKLLNIINLCAKNLMDYLGKILDVVSSKNHHHDEQEIFHVKETIHHISAMLQPLINQKGLSLHIHCPDIAIKSHKMGFEQICLNLLSNAVKFTEKGSITVTAELKNNCLKLSVVDTGIGIAKKDHEIIFDKFHRVTPSYLEPEFRGCGLGLSLAKDFVQKMNGKISVHSALHKGSTFHVSLPLQ